ncbi:MAG: T9SS type A sorting domain-containing protein [Candidatus Electryonea clarkiae]|nr:T9SS type A sorting domain-containing protein [Candidatus Electryonea clarkiae]MDP8288997.1 T9SS type A sorting domain-containing protein [Candidatus Electryonea clarkiae]
MRQYSLPILAVLLLVLFSFPAQADLELLHLRRMYDASTYAHEIFYDGGSAYLLDSYDGLGIVDLSDSTYPRFASRIDLTEEYHSRFVIKESTAYIGGDSLYVVDIEDRYNPSLVLTVEDIGAIRGVTIKGDTLAVIKNYDTYLFDISNPEQPELISHLNNFDFRIYSIIFYRDYLLQYGRVNGQDYELRISEIDENGELNVIGEISDLYSVAGYAISGDYLIITEAYEGFYIFDLSDPENPEQVHFNPDWDRLEYFEVHDSYLYCRESRSITVHDISDPADIEQIGTINLEFYPRNFVIHEDELLIEYSNYLVLLNIEDIENVSQVSEYLGTNSFSKICIYPPYAYLTCPSNPGNLRTLDISYPGNPVEINYLNLPINKIVVSGDYASAIGNFDGMKILDLSDPENPEEFSQFLFDENQSARDIFIDDDYVYTIVRQRTENHDYSYFISIIDVYYPDTPTIMFNGFHYDNISNILVDNGYLFFSRSSRHQENGSAINIYSLEDPMEPVFVNIFEAGSNLRDFVVGDSLLFVLNGTNPATLSIFDISDPENVELRSSFEFDENSPVKMDIDSEQLYVLFNDALAVLDFTDPDHPCLISDFAFNDFDYACDFQVFYPYIYIVSQYHLDIFAYNEGIFSVSIDTLAVSIEDTAQETSEDFYISNPGAVNLNVDLYPSPVRETDDYLSGLIEINVTEATEEMRSNCVAFVNDTFYVAGSNNYSNPNKIYLFDESGEYIRSFDQPENEGNDASLTGFTDLTFDDTMFWGVEENDIVAFNMVSGEENNRFAGPFPLNPAVTFDPDNDQLWIGAFNGIASVDPETGEEIHRIDFPNRIRGLSYLQQPIDGYSLFILSFEGDEPCQLYKMNLETEDYKFISSLDPDNRDVRGLFFGDDYFMENANYDIALGIIDTREADFIAVWEMGMAVDWVSISPERLSIAPGDSQSVSVTFGSENLENGNYFGNIVALNNSRDDVINIPFLLTVGDANSSNGTKNSLPESYTLNQPYPNPFNETVRIKYALPERSDLKLVIYDILGREVIRLEDGMQNPGWHQTTFNARGLSSGIYFVQAEVPGKMKEIRKIILIK